MYKIKAQKLIYRAPQKRNFLEASIYTPQDAKEKRLGKICIFIETEDESIESAEISQGILEIITNQYYKERASTIEERLEKTLQKLNDILGELITLGKNKWVNHLNTLIAVVYKNQIYLSKTGKAYALLIRGRENISITEDSSPSLTYPIRIFRHILSGRLEDGDYLILGNAGLFSYFSDYKLSQILQTEKKLRASKEVLQEIILEQGIPKNIVALLLFVKKEKIKDTKPEPSQSSSLKTSNERLQIQEAIERRKRAKLRKKFPYFFFYLILDLLKKILSSLSFLKEVTSKKIVPFFSTFFIFLFKSFKKQIRKKLYKEKSYQRYYSIDLHSKEKSLDQKFINYLKRLQEKVNLTYLFFFRKRKIIFVLLSVFLLIFTSLLLLFKKKNTGQEEIVQDQLELLSEARRKKEEAEDALIFNDQNKAKNLLIEAKSLTQEVLGDKIQNEEAQNLQKDIEKQINKIYKIEKIDNLTNLIADLSPIQPTNFQQMISFQNDLYFYSNEDKTIIKINLDDNKIKIISPNFSEIEEIKEGTNMGDELLILLSTANNIFIYYPQDNRLEKSKGIKIEGEISKIQGYDAKLFLLNKSKNQIFRYLRTLSGFSKPSLWLQESLVLEEIKDLAIDGAIYLLDKKGEVKKYFKGKKQNFNLEEIDIEGETLDKIFTAVNYRYIYLSSKTKKRIIIFDKKDGRLIKQLFFTTLSSLDDFWVEPKEEKIYFLSENKIWEIPLESP